MGLGWRHLEQGWGWGLLWLLAGTVPACRGPGPLLHCKPGAWMSPFPALKSPAQALCWTQEGVHGDQGEQAQHSRAQGCVL